MEIPIIKNKGYIKIHRIALENGWLQNSKLWAFWCWILLSATHKKISIPVGGTNSYQRVELLPGQLIFGRKAAAKVLDVSEKNIRSMLNNLQKSGNISVKAASKFSIITVINWDYYQGDDDEMGQEGARKGPGRGQEVATNKKDIIFNVKKEYIIPEKNRGECATIISEYLSALSRVSEKIAEGMSKHQFRFEFECNWLLENGYTGQQIRKAANWARQDGFWSKNFQSFSKLLEKNNQGTRYIDVFLLQANSGAASKKSTGPANPTREYFASGNQRNEG